MIRYLYFILLSNLAIASNLDINGQNRFSAKAHDDKVLLRLKRQANPVIVSGNTNVEQKEGETVYLRCAVESSQDPDSLSITWLKSGSPLRPTSRVKSLIQNYGQNGKLGSIHFTRVYYNDSAIYTCVASDQHGYSEKRIQLKVKGKTLYSIQLQICSIFERSKYVYLLSIADLRINLSTL